MSGSGPGASPAAREEIAAARRMHELITRSLLVQAIFVASRLRIPDLLAGEARTAEELAAATGAQPAALHRLLRALTGLEVVTVEGDRYALTSLAVRCARVPTPPPSRLSSWALLRCGRPGGLLAMRSSMARPPSGTRTVRGCSATCPRTRTRWRLSRH